MLLTSKGTIVTEAVQTDNKSPSKGGHHNDALLSWWLASAIVGADIGTSVFYTTGVILPLVGFAAPFVVLEIGRVHV